jgi:glycine cleavage system protein P-like pyridoxal-binding family
MLSLTGTELDLYFKAILAINEEATSERTQVKQQQSVNIPRAVCVTMSQRWENLLFEKIRRI